ncbi:MAG: glucokinase [Betaproteobacteria bacterium]|nr:glucokinase [Betaproteobacteria bacterium]
MALPTVLLGDIGGTHSRLELLGARDGEWQLMHEQTYRSEIFAGFDALIDDFYGLEPVKPVAPRIEAACFSVAGPVEGRASTLTNLNWTIDAAAISARLAIPDVLLVNDFAAVGHGIAELGEHDLLTLQRGVARPNGTRVVVGAGTGLGVCMLTRQRDGYAVHPSEGGHTDFAPTNDAQDILLANLRQAFGRVSYERLVSGPGLLRIFSVLENGGAGQLSKQLRDAMQRGDASAAISEFAINKADPLAVHALDLFVDIYGAFAGNMALAMLARGGVYLAGGIARQIAHKLGDGSFVHAFTHKGRFSDVLRRYPLHIVTDPKVGLKGAARLLRKELRLDR